MLGARNGIISKHIQAVLDLSSEVSIDLENGDIESAKKKVVKVNDGIRVLMTLHQSMVKVIDELEVLK